MTRDSHTVKDVAERIAPSRKAADLSRLIRQIRHWTLCDLLTTEGDKHTGTGRSRVYDAHQVRKAAILAELARFGINVGELEGFGEWADSLARTTQWAAAVAARRDVFIQMAWTADGGASWGIAQDAPNTNPLSSTTASSPVRRGDGRQFELPEQDFTASIVLNVTKVFKRLAL